MLGSSLYRVFPAARGGWDCAESIWVKMNQTRIRTSTEIRQDFLDFFRSKQHAIVPSARLMPDSPNLLFTNAGMNQFVPIFLGQTPCPYQPGRAADTQKCIRAGGKHNDLDDVGLDTYHHTFFEMLGNWSFGDYFKREAIDWAWELIVGVWQFPPQRLYATVYAPNASLKDPSAFDQEAWDFWAAKFRSAGLDPAVHIVNGNKKDNFWMMGETGPCGPCSELHVDLTPEGDTRGSLVNKGDARCIEIWNLVFIQFNANPDGTYSPLPARHVDTGMGFERVTSIIQGTRGFTDFKNARISNYETDIFRPLFDALEGLSGCRYGSTLPEPGSLARTRQEQVDVAFRVIADHIRTLGFAIADGIMPGNSDRHYVLRRILRRAVRYGRTLGFREPFFYKLVDVLARTMGDVFPEIRSRRQAVQEVIRTEEESFNKTLDRGIEIFNARMEELRSQYPAPHDASAPGTQPVLPGSWVFELYDTYGFPLDLTELMAREQNVGVDAAGFETLMTEQRERARSAQKREIISLTQITTNQPTRFVGFDQFSASAKVLEVAQLKDKTAVILDASPCYAEMGGQVGDQGEILGQNHSWGVVTTRKSGPVFLHFLAGVEAPPVGAAVTVQVNRPTRNAIQRHHTVTHLLHWALHQIVGNDVTQKGSHVGADKLTFDFNSAPLTPAQICDVESLVNERILENGQVSWMEIRFDQVKGRQDIMQFFGDKYGEQVRVVQVGGHEGALDGYSMELCGGTHVRATGEIGMFRIVSENAVAAGVRRIEAVAGLAAIEMTRQQARMLRDFAGKLNAPVHELEKKLDGLLFAQKDLEKSVKTWQRRQAGRDAQTLLAQQKTINGIALIAQAVPDAGMEYLQHMADALKGQFQGVLVLGGVESGSASLVATVPPELVSRIQAGKIIQTIAPIVGGKGGGKPTNACGGGKDVSKLNEALDRVQGML